MTRTNSLTRQLCREASLSPLRISTTSGPPWRAARATHRRALHSQRTHCTQRGTRTGGSAASARDSPRERAPLSSFSGPNGHEGWIGLPKPSRRVRRVRPSAPPPPRRRPAAAPPPAAAPSPEQRVVEGVADLRRVAADGFPYCESVTGWQRAADGSHARAAADGSASEREVDAHGEEVSRKCLGSV